MHERTLTGKNMGEYETERSAHNEELKGHIKKKQSFISHEGLEPTKMRGDAPGNRDNGKGN